MCQACVDGGDLRQSTYDKILEFLDEFPQAEFGPAHIVVADCNVDNGNIRGCLKRIHKMIVKGQTDRKDDTGHPIYEYKGMVQSYWDLFAASLFLTELLLIPEKER